MNKNLINKILKTKLSIFCTVLLLLCFLFIISCEQLNLKKLVKIDTGEISELASNYAIISGAVLDVGEEGYVEYGYCWSTVANPDINGEATPLRTAHEKAEITGVLEGLNPATTYYTRAYARNSSIVVYGEEINFTTRNNIAIEWQKSFGGSYPDYGKTIIQTTDGGFIVGGATESYDGNVSGNHGMQDVWVVKLSNTGTIQWQKCFGGSNNERVKFLNRTTDGGCVIAAESNSDDGNIPVNYGGCDFWVIKLNSAGEIEWQSILGGTSDEDPNWVIQTEDGGYMVAGRTLSNDGFITGNHGDFDFWIVKLDNAGGMQWQKCLGGSNSDAALSIQQIEDGGYVVVGRSYSNDGDVSGNHGVDDFWVVKVNSTGTIEWQKSFGGSDGEGAKCIVRSTDGGYFVAGATLSNNGNVTNNRGNNDQWVIKLNSAGAIQWQKTLGGSAEDRAYSIVQTSDGGCIVAGDSESNDRDVSGNHGNSDYWIAKLGSSGNLQWQKSLGGSNYDRAECIIRTADFGYVLAGSSFSTDGNVTGNHGDRDLWVVKLK